MGNLRDELLEIITEGKKEREGEKRGARDERCRSAVTQASANWRDILRKAASGDPLLRNVRVIDLPIDCLSKDNKSIICGIHRRIFDEIIAEDLMVSIRLMKTGQFSEGYWLVVTLPS